MNNKIDKEKLDKQLTGLGYEKTNVNVGWENKLYVLKNG